MKRVLFRHSLVKQDSASTPGDFAPLSKEVARASEPGDFARTEKSPAHCVRGPLYQGGLYVLSMLLIAALLGGLADAQAQTWPTRPIRMIVSFPAGSAPDIVCRFLTDRLSRAVGQQIIVDNRPGSGNILAGQAAARSAPDGYNFFCATAATLVSNPHTFKSLPYDPVKDFVPVSMIAKGPFFVLVHPSVPVKTLAELVAYDKANPGKLAWATDGL